MKYVEFTNTHMHTRQANKYVHIGVCVYMDEKNARQICKYANTAIYFASCNNTATYIHIYTHIYPYTLMFWPQQQRQLLKSSHAAKQFRTL